MARSIVTIDDITNEEIERLFDLADKFLSPDFTDKNKPYRIRGRHHITDRHVLSTLFYEPSTRTRFSFETAMLRLGGHILSSADPKSTSAAKGESLADTIRVVENYADIIVLRHPLEGSSRVAADFTDLPVINAGDGSHEHPTQTLCDLYTLRREGKKLKGLNVLLCGDLKNGRTIHSLVYALARFGAHIRPLAAKGLELPSHVQERLERDYRCVPVSLKDEECDVVYVTPDAPHTPTIFTRADLTLSITSELNRVDPRELTQEKLKEVKSALTQIDVCYVTRLQKERLPEGDTSNYPLTVDTKFLKDKRYEHSSVLHPLPRVTELGYDMDNDPRGIYFKQASYGVPVRMALITALLGLESQVLGPDAKPVFGDKQPALFNYLIYSTSRGLTCSTPNCVTNAETEKGYLLPKFWMVLESPLTLRCVYCEHEVKPACAGSKLSKKFHNDTNDWKLIHPEDLVLFRTASEAKEMGFQPYKRKAKKAPASEPQTPHIDNGATVKV